MINGEAETGVSVIRMSRRIDAGDVVGRQATRIDPMETAGQLEQRLAELGPRLMLETLALHEAGRLDRQLHRSKYLQRRVHGLTPWPGCTVRVAGSTLKLSRVAVADDGDEPLATGAPGQILDDHTVACLEGRVRLLAVQPPGGTSMSFEAYLRGHPVPAGAGIEPR